MADSELRPVSNDNSLISGAGPNLAKKLNESIVDVRELQVHKHREQKHEEN